MSGISMIGSAEVKRKNSLNRVREAIKEHNGCTLMFYAQNLDVIKTCVETGIRMLEVSGGSVYKDTDIFTDYWKNETPLEERVQIMKIVRNIVGNNVYITLPGYGTFTDPKLIPFTDKEALAMAMAGADGCHTHIWLWNDLKELVEVAHRNGLIVDAYISHSKDKYNYYGINADTPEEVATVTKKMEKIGVDMIGIMSGMTYMGLKSGKMNSDMRERIKALVETAKVPTLVEGGINITNFREFKETGVNVIIIGNALKKYVNKAIVKFINKILG